MRIAGINRCSFVNGPGARYVIFVQGCEHHCKGCQNPSTWDMNGGEEISVEALAGDIYTYMGKHPLDGITLSGGDPFYQQDECVQLLELLDLALGEKPNTWVYTGFEFKDIRDTALARMSDALVAGPYIEELKCEDKLYGSSNQRIIRNI